MGMSKKAIVVLVPSLLFGIGAPAWSGTAEQAAPTEGQMVQAEPYGNTLLGMLSSILTATDPSPRQPQNPCKASHLYSQHDVVGDPEACIMGRYTLGNGATSTAGIPAGIP
jgi:hypothetical protein